MEEDSVLPMEELKPIAAALTQALERQDEAEARRLIGALMGKSSRGRKGQTSAENGKRGGRPRGSATSEETRARMRASQRARWSQRKHEQGEEQTEK